MASLSREQLAEQAGVDLHFVDRLIDIGALEGAHRSGSFGSTDLSRVRLLRAWEDAGLQAEGIIGLVRKGGLSIEWLSAPVMTRARPAGRHDRRSRP